MPSSSSPRFGLGQSSVLLGAVLLFVLAGMWAGDRALEQADEANARVDAAKSAALAESFLDTRAEALNALRALYQSRGSLADSALVAYSAALAEFLPGFRDIWVADSTGAVREEVLVERIDDAHRPTLDAEHLAALRGAVRRAGIPRPGVPATTIVPGPRELLLVQPLVAGGDTVGFIGASVTTAALLASVQHDAERGRRWLLVIAGRDTVARLGRGVSAGGAHLASAGMPAPDGRRWLVVTAHEATDRLARALLWTLGLGALALLALGLLRERRETARTAARSRELERLSSELLRANRAKSEFLANVSHELRTPLNAIVGFVELLKDGVYGELGPRQIAPVDRIAASATHLRHLVDQVLDIAKMAAGRLEVHLESVDLRPFVLDVATEVEPLVGEKGLTLSLGVGATLPRVRTDPQHLRQILVNLIGNAVKYTDQGSLGVRARLLGPPAALPPVVGTDPRSPRLLAEDRRLLARTPDPEKLWIAVLVSDTGIGIAPEDQERIFEEFEQVGAGSRSDSLHRGTGLGLAISRRLARLLGGDVVVESELGKGSTFTLYLPVNPADLRTDARRRTPTDAQKVEG